MITVQSYGGDDEAIAMANGVDQRLTASVWTDSHSRAMRFLRDLDFGAVSVNAHAPMGSELPHGGFGSSGYGKTSVIRPGRLHADQARRARAVGSADQRTYVFGMRFGYLTAGLPSVG